MDELIRILVEEPSLLSDFRPEFVEGIDMALVSIMIELQRQGIKPTYQVLKHQLPQIKVGDSNLANLIPHLDKRMATEITCDPMYVLAQVRDDYNRRTLFSLFNEGLRMNGSDSVENTVQLVQERLRSVALGSRSKTMQGAADATLDYLETIWNGTVVSYWKTGHEKWDRIIATSRRQLVMIAANQKQGKTSVTLDKVMRLHKNQPQISFLWFTFEMHTNEVIISMIAWLTSIDPRIINGKSGIMPTEEQRAKIRVAKNMISEMPITFYDQKMSIDTIRKNVDRKMTDDCVVIIDNVGLIRNDAGLDSVGSDNEIANALVDMRDNTNAHIIVLHHMSKQIEHYTNKDNGYAPQVQHIRGSNKWMDSVNCLVMLHRQEMYKEIMDNLNPESRERAKGKMQVIIPLVRDGEPGEFMTRCKMGLCQFEEIEELEF